jgi:hypothetical protein
MIIEFFALWLLGDALLLGYSFVEHNAGLGVIAGVLLLLLGIIVFADGVQYKSGESTLYTSPTVGVTTNQYSPLAFSPPATTQTVVALPLVLTGLGVSFAKVASL